MVQRVFVFVVGRSGSGKTTSAKIFAASTPTIAESMFSEKLPTLRFKDYDILYKMYENDKNHRFHKTDYPGFGVIDYAVFDEALETLVGEVKDKVPSDYNGIVTIEFARNNYQDAIKKFKLGDQEKAHLLFVDCEVNECIRRIHKRVSDYKRVSDPPTPDSHFVPDDIMLSYFSHDNIDYMSYFGEDPSGYMGQHYKTEFPFLEKVKVIDNTHLSIEAFQREVESFANIVVQNYFEECRIPSLAR